MSWPPGRILTLKSLGRCRGPQRQRLQLACLSASLSPTDARAHTNEKPDDYAAVVFRSATDAVNAATDAVNATHNVTYAYGLACSNQYDNTTCQPTARQLNM